METLSNGVDEWHFTDPGVVRAWARDHERRDFADTTRSEAEAVRRRVRDGDRVSVDLSSFTRGPLALVGEIIRRGRRNLWHRAWFTMMEPSWPTAAGVVSRLDAGFPGLGETVTGRWRRVRSR
jgi:hypothetical protein